MKHIILAFSLVNLAAATASAAPYSSYENKGEDYGDIYSTRGNRDIYTTEDDRQGIYTTKDSGSYYSTEDKRESIYTTEEAAPSDADTDVSGAELNDGGDLSADSVYDGYMP